MEILNKNIHQKVERPIRIMQYGEGNFLRAFIDWFIDEMNHENAFNTNVAVVQPLPLGRVSDLKQQDGLYTLIMEGLSNNEIMEDSRVIDVFNDYINPYTQYEHYSSYATSTDLKMLISNTTESGIVLDINDIDYTKTPITFPGKVLALLKKRYDHFLGAYDRGLFIVACELIDNNGDELKHCLLELAKVANYDENFIKWLVEANKFYNTLVDRIVPGYPKDQVEVLEQRHGYVDNNMVKAEVFHLWVIEGDSSIKDFLPIHQSKLNILYTDNIKPYKERKVKILNGAHTCMVPVAYLYQLRYVTEVMEHDVLSKFISNFIEKEVLLSIDLPIAEILEFKKQVFERFANPFVQHELLSISLNSMTKYKTRILPSAIKAYEKTHELPKYALFSLSALFNMYFLKKSDQTSLISDDAYFIDLYKSLEQASDEKIVDTLMCLEHWGYDFSKMDNATTYVLESFKLIKYKGMEVALKALLGSQDE